MLSYFEISLLEGDTYNAYIIFNTVQFVSNKENTGAYESTEHAELPSEVNEAIEDLTAKLELKMARVTSGAKPDGKFEEKFKILLDKTKEVRPQRYEKLKQRMTKVLASYKNDKKFKTFAGIDVNQAGALDKVNLGEKHKASLGPIVESWAKKSKDGGKKQDPLVPQSGAINPAERLKFYLNSVKCIETTKEVDRDEVYIGYSCIDESTDLNTKFALVKEEFKKGQTHSYPSPGKYVTEFNITEGKVYPKSYIIIVSGMEADGASGIANSFEELFQAVDAEIAIFLAAAGTTVVTAAALGTSIGAIAGPIGALAGALIGAIAGGVFAAITAGFDDDYMGSFETRITLNRSTNEFSSGSPNLSNTKRWVDSGGIYDVSYTWTLAQA